MIFCRQCVDWAFSRWRGWCSNGTKSWKEKPDLPEISQLTDEGCPRCNGTEGVDLSEIFYQNYHGEYSTGLPDYFTLGVNPDNADALQRFGRPYQDSWVTRRIPLDQLDGEMKNSRYR